MLLRAAVLIPLSLAAVLPDSVGMLVCRYTGVVMPEASCCPELEPPAPSSQARLSDESCCMVKTVHVAKLVSDRQSTPAAPVHDQIGACASTAESHFVAARPAITRRPAILPVGPPIILVRHAFLI